MYIKHVSFQDLSPSLIDDQARSLKESNKPITYNNPFIHVPPQFNPLYSDPSVREGSQSESVSNDSGVHDFSMKRPQLSTDLGFCSSQQDVGLRNMLGPTLSNDNSEYGSMNGLRRSKTGMSSVSSASTSLTRAATSSSAKLPPPPAVSILKRDSLDDLHREHSPDGIDLTVIDPQMEKRIEKVTTSNTLENAGNKYGSGYTTSAFANLNELEDKLIKKQEKKAEPEKRKKSYMDMTDEELAQLEKQLRSGGRETNTDLNSFDFSQQYKLYIGNTVVKPSPSSKSSGAGGKPSDMTLNYPSRPSITHKAISITKEHTDYRKRYTDTNTRTVVCFLNGRRHTWATVDWFIKEAARDGDHLVVATNLPMYEELINMLKKNESSETGSTKTKLEEFTFDGKIKNKTPSAVVQLPFRQVGMIINELDQLTRYKCENMLNYYAAKCQDKVMKITIELVKELSAKPLVTHVMDLYRPNFHVVSTISTNLSIKFRNGNVKLPNFLYRHLWVPTVIIPFEFIDPYHLGEAKKPMHKTVSISTKDDQFAFLDRCIIKSLNDVLGTSSKNDHTPRGIEDVYEHGNDDMVSIDSEADKGITDYFPTSPEAQRRKQHIERLGYVPPEPTRFKNNSFGPVASRNSTMSSRRPSRVYFADEPGMYKVKSLLGGDDDSSSIVRRVKSEKLPSVSSPKRPSTSYSYSAKVHPTSTTNGKGTNRKSNSGLKTATSGKSSISSAHQLHSATNGSSASAQTQTKSKSKSKLGGMFRKMFGVKSNAA